MNNVAKKEQPPFFSLAFLHQKGGTGKSTLTIGCAMVLRNRDEAVLLIDADPQGTTSEWCHRYGEQWGIECYAAPQPDLHSYLEKMVASWQSQQASNQKKLPAKPVWVLVDGPPGLSDMSMSIMRSVQHVLIPTRPAWPDIWALRWLAAALLKIQREESQVQGHLVFNQCQQESVDAFVAEANNWRMTPSSILIPHHSSLEGIFSGVLLPQHILTLLDQLLAEVCC